MRYSAFTSAIMIGVIGNNPDWISADLKTFDLYRRVHLHCAACTALFLDLTNLARGTWTSEAMTGRRLSVAARDSLTLSSLLLVSRESERESEFLTKFRKCDSDTMARENFLHGLEKPTPRSHTRFFFKLIGCRPAPHRISTENKLAVCTSCSRISDCVR